MLQGQRDTNSDGKGEETPTDCKAEIRNTNEETRCEEREQIARNNQHEDILQG